MKSTLSFPQDVRSSLIIEKRAGKEENAAERNKKIGQEITTRLFSLLFSSPPECMEALASLMDSSVLTLESTRKVLFRIQTASPWAGIVILLLELLPLQDPQGQLGPQHSASTALPPAGQCTTRLCTLLLHVLIMQSYSFPAEDKDRTHIAFSCTRG